MKPYRGHLLGELLAEARSGPYVGAVGDLGGAAAHLAGGVGGWENGNGWKRMRCWKREAVAAVGRVHLAGRRGRGAEGGHGWDGRSATK